MVCVFYVCSTLAIITTLFIIMNSNPIHALLYLIISLLALAGIFFSLGAYFAGALEIIIYAGAIMVIFVFVVMMLNLGKISTNQEKEWLRPIVWVGPSIIAFFLMLVIIYAIIHSTKQIIKSEIIDIKTVGISLFGKYIIAVELTSILMLAGLIVAFHIGQQHKIGK
ncbi:NADH-quinone oxidoreductase subunit J, partial [Candidatus Ishikawella capsulata]|uniref:NADH-quinone oxidoreductase subunit J n=1 Tax=Candidatus Ishikawaella capsulata Mpkobe TaxID=476281 RepID=C5WC66_9ENTR